MYDQFKIAYNTASELPLPDDWQQLIGIEDIPAMLALINRDDAPADWIEDISVDIQKALDNAGI